MKNYGIERVESQKERERERERERVSEISPQSFGGRER